MIGPAREELNCSDTPRGKKFENGTQHQSTASNFVKHEHLNVFSPEDEFTRLSVEIIVVENLKPRLHSSPNLKPFKYEHNFNSGFST